MTRDGRSRRVIRDDVWVSEGRRRARVAGAAAAAPALWNVCNGVRHRDASRPDVVVRKAAANGADCSFARGAPRVSDTDTNHPQPDSARAAVSGEGEARGTHGFPVLSRCGRRRRGGSREREDARGTGGCRPRAASSCPARRRRRGSPRSSPRAPTAPLADHGHDLADRDATAVAGLTAPLQPAAL